MNVHMDSEAEDDRDNEGARYVDCSNLYNDVDDIGEGDGDLDDAFVVVKGASKKEFYNSRQARRLCLMY